MEYILKGTESKEARLKGTPGAISFEGLARRKKILFMSFQTWLYFLRSIKQSLSTGIWALHHFLHLVVFCEKGGVK